MSTRAKVTSRDGVTYSSRLDDEGARHEVVAALVAAYGVDEAWSIVSRVVDALGREALDAYDTPRMGGTIARRAPWCAMRDDLDARAAVTR